MPKVGMEPIRRKSLIEAALAAIHDRGSLDVTMSDIARRAGVSQGLAHHYFDSKEHLIVSAMRHLLSEYGRAVRARLPRAGTPRERVSAIISASLDRDQFQPETVSAWLVFYVHAQSSPSARRLLTVYPHPALVPALSLMSLVLGLNLLADGLREESLRD